MKYIYVYEHINIYLPMFLAVLFAIIKTPGRSSELSSEQQHSLAPNMHIHTHTHSDSSGFSSKWYSCTTEFENLWY